MIINDFVGTLGWDVGNFFFKDFLAESKGMSYNSKLKMKDNRRKLIRFFLQLIYLILDADIHLEVANVIVLTCQNASRMLY